MSATLDAIRKRAAAYAEHGTPGLHAPQDRSALLAIIDQVRAIHEPIDAAMFSGRRERIVKVCTGCGTDDGNWQRWPCPTIKALEAK